MSIEKLHEVSSELAAAKAKLQAFAKEQGKEAIGAAFRQLFEKHADARAFGWQQYTPRFNDGDPCTFGIHGGWLIPSSAPDPLEESAYEYEMWGDHPEGVTAECRADFKALWKQLDRQILEAVFGDGYEITITKDEVTIEDCDHD